MDSLATSPSSSSSSSTTPTAMHSAIVAKVAIIGAGASGLQCAQQLVTQYGFAAADIVVLEARDRIGGRIYSTRKRRRRVGLEKTNGGQQPSEVADFVMDHGAAWVHGTGYDWGVNPKQAKAIPWKNPMIELLEKTGPLYDHHLIKIFDGNPWTRPHSVDHEKDEIALFVSGKRVENNDPVIRLALERHYAIIKAVETYVAGMFDSGKGLETVFLSLQDAISKVQDQVDTPVKTTTADEAMFDQAKIVSRFYQHLIECWYGMSAGKLQLCEFSADEKSNGATTTQPADLDSMYKEEGDFYGPHCTLRHGMESVLKPLLENGIRDRVLLNEEVCRMSFHEGGDVDDDVVLIKTKNGLQIEAESCVLTIPAGCLKEAVRQNSFFGTELSNDKLEAIGLLSMGTYKKVFLTFDRIFWPQKQAFIGMIRSTGDESCLGNYLLFDNLWARDNIPCIEAVLFGTSGVWATNKSTEEIRGAVLEFMREAMCMEEDIKAFCTDCEVTRWEEDPYSGGAYSSMGLGTMIRHADELRRPEWNGRLVFCGEATVSEYEGSVYAALISGERAAEDVSKCVAQKVQLSA